MIKFRALILGATFGAAMVVSQLDARDADQSKERKDQNPKIDIKTTGSKTNKYGVPNKVVGRIDTIDPATEQEFLDFINKSKNGGDTGNSAFIKKAMAAAQRTQEVVTRDELEKYEKAGSKEAYLKASGNEAYYKNSDEISKEKFEEELVKLHKESAETQRKLMPQIAERTESSGSASDAKDSGGSIGDAQQSTKPEKKSKKNRRNKKKKSKKAER